MPLITSLGFHYALVVNCCNQAWLSKTPVLESRQNRIALKRPASDFFRRKRLRTSTLMGISSDGKFETFSYCHTRRVFDVQDAPEHVRLGLGRSVNEKWSHR